MAVREKGVLELIAHAPQPPVWGADKEWEPVPITGDAERPVPENPSVKPVTV